MPQWRLVRKHLFQAVVLLGIAAAPGIEGPVAINQAGQ